MYMDIVHIYIISKKKKTNNKIAVWDAKKKDGEKMLN